MIYDAIVNGMTADELRNFRNSKRIIAIHWKLY